MRTDLNMHHTVTLAHHSLSLNEALVFFSAASSGEAEVPTAL